MIVDRKSMTIWIVEALEELEGYGTILEVSKKVWQKHGEEITSSGDAFYTWQYELRWAGDILRKQGVLKPAEESPRRVWKLSE